MVGARRARRHQQVARALEEVPRRRLEEHSAELAEHFAQSTEREDLEKALRFGEMAAKRSIAVHAYGEAVRQLERCIQVQEVVDPNNAAKLCDLYLALGEAPIPGGEPLRAADYACTQAFSHAEDAGDRPRAVQVAALAIKALDRLNSQVVRAIPEYRRWAEAALKYADPGSPQRVWGEVAAAQLGRTAQGNQREA